MGSWRRALVIGGSVGGLFAAIRLLRDGWDVEVFERSPVELAARGAGIVVQPQVVAALRSLGLGLTRDLGVDVSRRQTLDRSGRVIAQALRPQVATSWNRLFDILRTGFPGGRYHLGRDLVGVEQDGSAVTARFADGGAATGDLLVGADGFRSSVRRTFAPQTRPLYAGYVAWRGLVEEEAFPPDLHRQMFGFFSFGLPPEEQILGYPVAGDGSADQAGRRRYNFVWYRPADELTELPRLLTDETGYRHEMSIPPPLIARAAIAEMRAHAEEVFPPQFCEIIRLTEQPFLQPIYDLESPHMAFGRVALIGDAAFVARPHVGAGTAKAADDAMRLADMLTAEGSIEAALARFEAERLQMGRRMVEQARRLGTYMKRDFVSEAERLRAERHRSPEAVMAETALLDFLGA
ncbi:FAD binding domain-containing protein [Enterovirga aerilata]|uniref:FAD-dependent oxidoreductase n=1 Tax=Enterovirga aerilata TaxID=2730920 RepID=A0A849I069_9HYPH|nr:FAD binding domain-containing protein [Enterovirga sp. DB1703]NNM70954.1 FAD-dependent oxidoreductase [Enterovirga sp. DB1703]